MTVIISDLDAPQELDRKAMAATRGGHSGRNHPPGLSRGIVVDGNLVNDGVLSTGEGNHFKHWRGQPHRWHRQRFGNDGVIIINGGLFF